MSLACWLPRNEMSPTEAEADFLYGLVRMLAPRLIVEAGTGIGYSTRVLSHAIESIPNAEIVSYDKHNLFQGPKPSNVELRSGRSIEWGGGSPGVAFLDSATMYDRMEELEHFAKDSATWLILHDFRDGALINLPLPEGGFIVPSPLGFWVRPGTPYSLPVSRMPT